MSFKGIFVGTIKVLCFLSASEFDCNFEVYILYQIWYYVAGVSFLFLFSFFVVVVVVVAFLAGGAPFYIVAETILLLYCRR